MDSGLDALSASRNDERCSRPESHHALYSPHESRTSWPWLAAAAARYRRDQAPRARRSRRSPAPQIIAVEANGESYDVTVRRHRRARRYTLRIHATRREAILSMPMRGNLADAKDFAQRHGAWLAERLRKLPDGVAFVDGASLPLRGEPHPHRPPSARARHRLAANAATTARTCCASRVTPRTRPAASRIT